MQCMPDRSEETFRRHYRLLAGAAVLASAVVLAVAAPWHGHGRGLVGRALAAVGQGSVLHAVITSDVPNETIVTLSSGAERPVPQRLEYWYDAGRDRLRAISTVNGRVVFDVLVPRYDSEPRLDPALTAFVSRYRAALKSGQAREAGRGTFDGRSIIWLRFAYRQFGERVGIDAHTYRPVVIEPLGRSGRPVAPIWKVASIETGPYAARDFDAARPGVPRLSISSRFRAVAPAKAARLLGWTPLWLGSSFRKLPLGSAQLQILTHDPPVPRRTTHGMYLAYGRGADRIQLSEARARERIYWLEFGGDPRPGALLLRRSVPQGSRVIKRDCQAMLRTGGVWVTVEGWNAAASLCVDAARALVKIPK
jgi:hypothetical protein